MILHFIADCTVFNKKGFVEKLLFGVKILEWEDKSAAVNTVKGRVVDSLKFVFNKIRKQDYCTLPLIVHNHSTFHCNMS